MKILFWIFIFLFVSALFIVSSENLKLGDKEDLQRFYGLYLSWFGKVFDNSIKIGSYVVKAEWIPSHSINMSKSTK